MNIEKTYIYGNSQILAQHEGDYDAARYFYLHDRLGSVRQVFDTSGNVVRLYTYEPFGTTLEEEGTLGNPFMFTGQFYDSEINEYYLRARMYDPYISRFISRDSLLGDFEEPLTVHAYLYCASDPVNKIDPAGLQGEPMNLRRLALVWNARYLEQEIKWGLTTAVEGLAIIMDWLAMDYAGINDNEAAFIEDLQYLFTERSGRWPGGRGEDPPVNFGQTGFAERFQEHGPGFHPLRNNQVRHFVGWVAAGYYWERTLATSRLYLAEHPYGGSRTRADWLLGIRGIDFGIALSWGPFGLSLWDAGDWVREHLTQ